MTSTTGQAGPLHSDKKYSQLYNLEGNQAVQERFQHPNNVSSCERTMQSRLTAIEDVSPYASAYHCMAEVEQGRQPKPVTMFFKCGHDERRYNSPLQDEIDLEFVGEVGAPVGFTNCDIVVHPRGRACERISILRANRDPMVS